MSSLDDLKQTLGAHAPEVDHDLAARPVAVARRVTAVRRRRTAAAATVAAAVIAGGSWYAVAGPQRDDHPPVVAGTDDPAPELALFPLEVGDYQYRAAALAEPGERTFERSTVLPSHVQFAIHCTAEGQAESGPRMPWVTIEVLGWQVLQVSCGAGGAPDDDPAAFLYGPATEDDGRVLVGRRTDADGTVRERRFVADRTITFTVRLTDKSGRDWTAPVDGLAMGIGIYGR